MKIHSPVQKISYRSLIAEIDKVGRENGRAFDGTKEKTIRPLLSTWLKWDFPNRRYKAERKQLNGKPILWVYLKEIKAPFRDQTSGDLEPNN